MADLKISQLPEVLSAPPDSWLVVVVMNEAGVAVTSKIKKSSLLP